MVVVEAKAIKDGDYRQVRQALSGYHLGYERSECWRVAVRIGRRWFKSSEKYSSEASASAAARRLA